MSVLNKYIFAGFEDDFLIDLTKTPSVCVCVLFILFSLLSNDVKHYFCIILLG